MKSYLVEDYLFGGIQGEPVKGDRSETIPLEGREVALMDDVRVYQHDMERLAWLQREVISELSEGLECEELRSMADEARELFDSLMLENSTTTKKGG